MDFFTAVPAPFELALEAQQAVIELIEYAKPLEPAHTPALATT
jgi:hypothetical protein